MDNEQLKQLLTDKFPVLNDWEQQYGLFTATMPAARNLDILQGLFDDTVLKFRFLTDITAIHYPDRVSEELCVVYHLHNLEDNIRLRLKAYLPIAAPDIESATPVFSGANWMERETYDFFGVNFLNHPNLTRILNVDEMDYFPMRKEYPMEDPTRMDKDDAMFGRG
jgi:NADH-quinone oxidoreductase subunit C